MDQKLEFQKKRNSNFFWVVPISFSNETRWIQIFCPDYLFFCWPHERTCFRQNDFQVLEFREGESDNSESKMFSIRFCRQIAQLSHWSNNASGLMMWACTLSFEQILVRSVSRPFFCPGSWLLATLCFVAIKPERVLVFLEVIFVGVSSNQFYFCPESSFLWFVFFSSSGLFSLKSFFGNSKVFWKPVSFFLHMFFWHFFLWECCSFLKPISILLPWGALFLKLMFEKPVQVVFPLFWRWAFCSKLFQFCSSFLFWNVHYFL